MDIGIPIRNFGKVDMEPLAAAILAQDEAAWNENVQRQRDYEIANLPVAQPADQAPPRGQKNVARFHHGWFAFSRTSWVNRRKQW